MKLGQVLFSGLLIYWLWEYIMVILMILGAYFVWKIWEENRKP